MWFAFVKFIKNQVTVNGRLVDTQLVGLFYRDNNNDGNVVYMPSPEYLEAGKFKLSRTSTSSGVTTTDISSDKYNTEYKAKLQSVGKSELCQLSFASIAMVAGTQKDLTKRILTDIFACLIETSRKTQREARLKFKGLGTLHLFKNREIAFLYEDDSFALDLSTIAGTKTSKDLFLER